MSEIVVVRIASLVCAAFLLAISLSACGDECSRYSSFSCGEIEKANYNVYFYYPGGSEQYLGQTAGLSQCGRIARSFAASKDLGNKDWGYICCMRAKGSECYEKHR